MATVDVILRRAIPLTVTRPTGAETVTDGYAVKATEAVENLTGFMAPLSPRELRYMPEGQNTLEWWNVWSASELKAGDVVSDGSAPAVTLNRMEYWKEGAFWHGHGVVVVT